MFVHLGMPGNWLAVAGYWMLVDVVPRTVAQQPAAVLLQLAQEVAALHTAISLMA